MSAAMWVASGAPLWRPMSEESASCRFLLRPNKVAAAVAAE
jgi:hypothetical protein